MARATLSSLTAALAKLERAYQAEFAGQPRHTRNPERLRKLAEKVSALLRKTGGLKGEEARALEGRLQEALRLYLDELRGVKSAVGQRGEIEQLAGCRRWAALLAARYGRHFAGQPRLTRDSGLLEELTVDLGRIRAQVCAIAEAVDTGGLEDELDGRLTQYAAELGEISDALGQASPEARQAALLAVAHQQLTDYARHFAGQPRISRDLGRLDRMLATLGRIQGELGDPALTERLALCESERAAIAAEQANQPPERRMNALGAAANAVFKAYHEHFAGQDRATRNPELLGQMADALGSIARSMRELDPAQDHADNRKNLTVVLGNLELYEREHPEIARLHKALETTPKAPPRLAGLLRAKE
jgi:hypothetical protein